MELKTKRQKVILTVPVAEPKKDVYHVRHLDVHLTAEQAFGLRRLFDGLHSGAFKLKKGKHIDTPTDAVRYILERIELEAGKTKTGRNGG